MLGVCSGLIRALDGPNFMRITETPSIEVVNTKKAGKILNVDTYSEHGISAAITNGLVWNDKLDAIFSPFLYEAAPIFKSSHRGRVFTVIRHPIERINGHFNSVKGTDEFFVDMNIEDYAKADEDRPEYNYFTKLLSNNIDKSSELLTVEDLSRAKEFLRRKTLIGLFSEKDETIKRFEIFFMLSFENLASKNTDLCGDGLKTWTNYDPDANPETIESDAAWSLLYTKNLFDMELYEYAQSLFMDQGNLIYNMQPLP